LPDSLVEVEEAGVEAPVSVLGDQVVLGATLDTDLMEPQALPVPQALLL
jgi:hypothetical protein